MIAHLSLSRGSLNVSSIRQKQHRGTSSGHRYAMHWRLYASEGPGTGRRHPPRPHEGASSTPGPMEKFPMLSAADMEKLMPLWVHSSCPPQVEGLDKEPAGLSAQCLANGPGTGQRMRPAPAMSHRKDEARIPYPGKMNLHLDLTAKKRYF